MPWKCPACGSRIFEEGNGQSRPRPDVVYRCAVCGLDVTFDPTLQKMQPLPVPFAVDRRHGIR
jgi:DNA-directed RNA polymerase subunit RPC12/RpoP